MSSISGADKSPDSVRVIGRYALYDEIASGGMATVHLARLLGVGGFARTVAVKRLHRQFAKDPEFVTAFLDEARLAARVRHPNVVPTLDVVATEGELFLVMEWIQGESLSRLRRMAELVVPLPIACGVLAGALHGLHAAHEAKNERGEPLSLVHRDISPQNILIGIDGVPRVADFGVAKAAGRVQTTQQGKIKGKLRYMSPEQLKAERLDRRADVFAASIVLWECLARQRLFRGEEAASVLSSVLNQKLEPPSIHNSEVSAELDAIVMRGLSRELDERWPTALDMAIALERAITMPSAHSVGEWVRQVAGESLDERANRVQQIESEESSSLHSLPAVPGLAPARERRDRISRSSISEAALPSTSDAVPVAKRTRVLLIAAAGGALVLAAAVIVLGLLLLRRPAPTPSAGALTAAPALSAAPASAPGPAASPGPIPIAPSASLEAPKKPAPHLTPRPTVNCNPPYTLVKSGGKVIKRWKPGCM